MPRCWIRAGWREVHASLKGSWTEYRYAVEQAVRHRRPIAVMIDEAQHLGKIPSGRRLLDQLDVIKSIANQTKTAHVLFGTYDLLAFRNLNGQLSRRSIDVHLARYRAEDSEERQTFIKVVRSFEKELPFEERPDLVSDWEFLYERSLGSVGVLKEWLVRAATVASRKGGHRLTRANLETQARRSPNASRCTRRLPMVNSSS